MSYGLVWSTYATTTTTTSSCSTSAILVDRQSRIGNPFAALENLHRLDHHSHLRGLEAVKSTVLIRANLYGCAMEAYHHVHLHHCQTSPPSYYCCPKQKSSTPGCFHFSVNQQNQRRSHTPSNTNRVPPTSPRGPPPVPEDAALVSRFSSFDPKQPIVPLLTMVCKGDLVELVRWSRVVRTTS